MNYMLEVAKMLGVKLGEEFEVDDYIDTKFRLMEHGAEIRILGKWECNVAACIVLQQILNGRDKLKIN